MVEKAIEILNKAKGLNFKLEGTHTTASGGVEFIMTYPSGNQSR